MTGAVHVDDFRLPFTQVGYNTLSHAFHHAAGVRCEADHVTERNVILL